MLGLRKLKLLAGLLSSAMVLSIVPANLANAIGADTFISYEGQFPSTEKVYRSVEDYSYSAEVKTVSTWSGHANMEIKFTNMGSSTIHDWYFTFDYNYAIENPYNCYIVEQEENLYTIGNNDWNQDIRPGQSVTIGFTAASSNGGAITEKPSFYLLNTKTISLGSSDLSYRFEQYSDWGSGYNGALILTNNSGEKIRDWRLDDYLNNTPYRFHRIMKRTDIPSAFTGLLDDYLEYCVEIGNKERTINAKKYFCLIFLQFLSDINCYDITEITAEIVAKSCLRYTNKNGFAALRQFLMYLFENKLITKDLSTIIPHYKHRQIVPSVFTPEEIKKIENTINIDTPTGKRNLAILLLVTRMGMRSGDIAELRRSSIDFSSSHIDLIQQKTGKPLSVFMPEDVLSALKVHIENAGMRLSDRYIFHSMTAPYGRLTTSIIRHIVNECIVSAGIDVKGRKHGPHALRSSLASNLVSSGTSYDIVRKILGHTDPDAVKHYVKTDIERLRKCALDPPEPTGIFLDLLCGRRRI